MKVGTLITLDIDLELWIEKYGGQRDTAGARDVRSAVRKAVVAAIMACPDV